MGEIMKKTHQDSYFMKVQLKATYPWETIGKENEIVLQTMILNEKEVIVELVQKDKYISA